MLGQRRRRWPSTHPPLSQSFYLTETGRRQGTAFMSNNKPVYVFARRMIYLLYYLCGFSKQRWTVYTAEKDWLSVLLCPLSTDADRPRGKNCAARLLFSTFWFVTFPRWLTTQELEYSASPGFHCFSFRVIRKLFLARDIYAFRSYNHCFSSNDESVLGSFYRLYIKHLPCLKYTGDVSLFLKQ